MKLISRQWKTRSAHYWLPSKANSYWKNHGLLMVSQDELSAYNRIQHWQRWKGKNDGMILYSLVRKEDSASSSMRRGNDLVSETRKRSSNCHIQSGWANEFPDCWGWGKKLCARALAYRKRLFEFFCWDVQLDFKWKSTTRRFWILFRSMFSRCIARQ